ncbi:MAG: class I SAM-dependent methyltransferase [Sphingomonadaceae bacterium]|nr:class I SAM-dependent methyltransferase [Sphingomonadaceae bacterium]
MAEFICTSSGIEKVQTLTGDHAGLMDEIYRGQRHVYDLTRRYYLLGRDRLIAEIDVPEGGTVLEIGCGTGRNLTQIAKKWPQARLYGLDISQEMLKSAALNLRRAGCLDRTQLERSDAAHFDALALFGRARFDRIMFSYTLSMIPDWQDALRQAAALLSTQGSIHIVDFGMQEGLPDWFNRALFTWLAKFYVEPRAQLFAFTQTLAKEIGRTTVTIEPYRGYAQMVVIR